MDINSIIFFFKYCQTYNERWNNKLSKKKFFKLSKKNYNEIICILKEIKSNKIYDYNNIQNYNKLLTCLYDKKEPINFFFSKTIEDISVWKDRI